MGLVLLVLIVLTALVIFIILWVISTSNRFKTLLVKIDEADSGIDIALTKRYDTLTKMLSVCKGYATHEAGLLENLVKFRRGMDTSGKNEANIKMDELQSKIFAIAENYPDLKASENYRQLQNSIVDAEDHLQAARRIYNMNISSYNQNIVTFPNSILANMQRHTKKVFFEAEKSKKTDVEMSF